MMEKWILQHYAVLMLHAHTVYCTNHKLPGVNTGAKAPPALPGNLYPIPAPQ